jgi:hypothetical protein
MPKYLFKANDDVISHCRCEDEPASSTSQLDCPWCGCGWMIGCTKCSKAFVYGEIRNTETLALEIVQRDAKRRGIKSLTEKEMRDWADAMEREFKRFRIGQRVIYLDGHYFPLGAKNVSFKGYYAKHKFKILPHAQALRKPEVLRATLGDPDYWFKRELPNRE